jgi:DNA-binding transcriptional MerR regulator
MREPVAKKAYYSIGDVCDLTGLRPHVLRYWETQFEALHPKKNRAGNRVYRPQDVELVMLLKNLLYEQRYTIDGARQRLKDLHHKKELDEERRHVVEPELLSGIKKELHELLDLLTPPPPRVDEE